ncbi:glycosyltransferase family 4 protein [Aureimonas populi]|uniref:Glycosyltransferase family 4 protein n=1 Tax=Aureimonas populi TaxID=1701758 RepID=A0ABW5CI12_9HYPH|nr:glycosyltransferase family 4 protein [Aureimonas populi]
MHIAYVCADPGIPVFGAKGASVHVQDMVRAMRRLGHEVTLIARRLGGTAPADLDDLDLARLPRTSGLTGAARESALIGHDPHVTALLSGLPGVDLVYERHSLWSAAAMGWAAAEGLPSVLEVNAPLVEEQAAHRGLVDRGTAMSMAREAMGRAGLVLCVSEPVAAHARAMGVEADRVLVEENGVDPVRFGALAPRRAPMEGTPFVVGFLGTLKPWHGTATLLEAVSRLRAEGRDVVIRIVGDGPERPALEEQARGAGLAGAVTFAGTVAPALVPSHLQEMHVGVAPYPPLHGFYFSPLKVLDYMAAGLPVVASRTGTLPELLREGCFGRLTEPGDAAALARALAAKMDDYPAALARAAEARVHALAERSWDGIAARALAAARPGIAEACAA